MTMRCEDCREQLLDSLYGLLDPAEEVALASHLAQCPACAQAKADAHATQRLFATAAKAPFPEVTFQIPVESEPQRPAPAPDRYSRWVIAAGLFIASLTLLAPAIRDTIAYRNHSSNLSQAQAKLNEIEHADKERIETNTRTIEALDRQLTDLREAHKQQIKTWVSAETRASAQPFRLEVSGPVAALPGALNEYAIVARYGDQTIPVTVSAIVRDSRGTEYFKQQLQITETILRLPSSLWTKFPAGAEDLVLAVKATNEAGATAELAEPIQLLAPVYTTLVVTDKPLYRPSERVFFRSLTLNRTNLQPPARDLTIRFELRKPDGTAVPGGILTGTTQPVMNRDGIDMPVVGPDGNPVRGIACGVLGLPDSLPGGEYTLFAFEIPNGWASPELPKGSTPIGMRKFSVAKFQPEVLTKTLEFDAKTYGPGDVVKASVTVRNQNKPLANIGLIVSAVYGKNTRIPVKQPGMLNAEGKAEIVLTLPDVPDLANPSLTVTILDQNNESLVRRIPLATKSLTLEFFPEGGDLIEGLPNRVYFRATTTTGSPADVSGVLTDGKQTICEAKTLTDDEHPGANQGLGVFQFTPQAGKRYAFTLNRPLGINEPAIAIPELAKLKTGYLLPKADAKGVVLSIPGGVFEATAPITGTVTSAKTKRNLLIGVYTRGLVVGHQRLTVEPGQLAEFRIAPPAVGIGGVTRVTVFEEPAAEAGRVDLFPLAERLVFRRPAETLKLRYSADRASYSPGDQVTLKVEATDAKNQPTAAILMAAVVNQSVISMADDKAERLLPTHFLLAGELQKPEQLEHADFILTQHPKAAETLDLLLGTQGWRRFAEVNGRFQSSSVSDTEKTRFWIANGKLQPMTESVQPDRLTAKGLEATGTIDAKIDQLEAEKQAAEQERDRKSAEWNEMNRNRALEAYRAHQTAEEARRNLYGGLAGIAALLGIAFIIIRFRTRRTLGGTDFLIGLGVLIVLAVSLYGYTVRFLDDSKLGREVAEANDQAEERAQMPRSTTDLREQSRGFPRNPVRGGPGGPADNVPPVALTQNEPPPRSDIGPAPPLRTAPPSSSKLLTDRADRAVRALADTNPDAREMTAIDRLKKALMRHSPFVVRQYAHVQPFPSEMRSNFTETVLWQPVLVLPGDGRTNLNFQVSDSINAYRVLLAGHTLDGQLGASTGLLEVRKPLGIEVKLPPEFSTSDRPLIPLIATNTTKTAVEARLRYWSDFLVAEPEEQKLTLPPDGGARRLIPVQPLKPGPALVRVSGITTNDADASERTVSIVPDGFPVAEAKNLNLTGRAQTTITIPENLAPKSLSLNVRVFVNSLADIQSGLEGLLSEPHGCFEQTSSTNYPNILVLEYLQEHNRSAAGLADQARGLLERGMTRLASFEVPSPAGQREGFEWFGHHPAHECLTAYGLLQFADLAKIMPVDPQLMARTKAYLLNRRDGSGGFKRTQNAHSFGSVPDPVANAYILWALAIADPKLDLAKEIQTVVSEAQTSGDPYRLALAANVTPTDELLKLLIAKQQNDGSFPGAETSITRSRGSDLVIETTALAVLALLKSKAPEFTAPLDSAIRFLVQSRAPHGTFGSTQATVLALKAIVAYNRTKRRTSETGEIIVRLDGKDVARLPFNTEDLRPVEVNLASDHRNLTAGTHEITLETQSLQTYPVSVSWSAFTLKPATTPDAPLNLHAALASDTVTEGESVRLNVTLTNREKTDTGMAIAIVGIPAGLKLPPDFGQLKALAARPKEGEPAISHWELNGRELALYWRGLKLEQVIDLSLDLQAEIPGTFRGPASRAYLYYGSDAKQWLNPLQIQIIPRDGR